MRDKVLTIFSVAFCTLCLASTGSQETAPSPSDFKRKVEMRLIVEEKQHMLGEEIAYQIEIVNRGPRPVAVGRQLIDQEGVPSNLVISVLSPVTGEQYTDSSPPIVELGETNLQLWWVVLSKNHYFGFKGRIDADSHRILGNPGTYELSARYKRLNPGGKEIGLGSAAEAGIIDVIDEINSNKVVVEILPKKH